MRATVAPRSRFAGLLPCLLGLCLVASGSRDLPGQGLPSRPVILISVDTLRADHLSCYGYKALRTPHIDAFTKDGTLFSQVSSQVPLTLPSHLSLLTSTFPSFNGNQDNGEMVPPNLVTLATVMKSQGYRTAAFVGGFVLDRRFGLGRGFDVYDSPFDLHHQQEMDPTDLKRSAEEVTKGATRWLQENSDRPFFLFMHVYDLHTPYKLSPSQRARFPGRGYDGALSYVDDALGKFRASLAGQGLLDKSLIVFLSDHGEGLGEHSESTHGYFIYQSTLRVPLIIHWPAGASTYPSEVDEPASLIDVAPSILEFLHLPRPAQFQGRSLLEFASPKKLESPREIFSESLYAHDHFGCSSLRSLRVGRYKYIDAPKPELYDLSNDRNEMKNLYASHMDLAQGFQKRVRVMRTRLSARERPAQKVISPEVVQRLASLGYVATGSAHNSPDSGVDPKDRILDYGRYRNAIAVGLSGNLEESAALLQRVLARAPDLADVWNFLGMTQQKMSQNEEAIASFRKALERDSSHTLAHYYLAVSYFSLSKFDEGAKELQATLALTSKSGAAMDQVSIPAEELLGRIYLRKEDWARAHAEFTKLLAIAPDDYVAHFNLAWLANREGQTDEAVRHLRSALAGEPKNAEARNALGSLYLDQGNLQAAETELSEAIRLDPKLAWAYYNLGRVFSQTGRTEQATHEFRKALALDPRLQPARDALSRLQGSGR